MVTASTPAIRQISRGIRILTIFISGLAFVVGPLLYILPDKTDSLFAWTINPPITAAFLGGGYGTALAIELLAARERIWARARIVYPAMLLFTSLTLLATLLHLDKFHFNAAGLAARGTAWAWFIIYVLAPPAMLVLLLLQLRAPGGDPPKRAPLPSWFRLVCGAEGAVMMAFGAALFLDTTDVAPLWPWKLTALTAQAVAAWMLGLGMAVLHGAWENDWDRITIAMSGNMVAGGLQLITLLRFALMGSPDVAWGAPSTWIYGLFLLAMIGIGLYGWMAARQATQHIPAPVPG